MGGWGTRVSELFYKESKSTEKKLIFYFLFLGVCVGVGGGKEGARVSDFFTKNPNLKLKKNFFGWGGGMLE